MEEVFPKEQVEMEERRRQARKARGKETRQEEGDGRDEPEGEKVRMEEEEKSMWDRKADGVASDRGKVFYIYLSSSARQTKERTLRRKRQCGLKNTMRMWWER